MTDEQRVEYINHYQDRISILELEIREYEKQIEGHKSKLPRLYYLEEEFYKDTDVYELRKHEVAQVFPIIHTGKNTVWIESCTQLDDIWKEAYALSQKDDSNE